MEIEVKDLDALTKTCQELGLELVQGQKTYKWWGHSVGDYPLPDGFKEEDLGKCDHAIRVPQTHPAYQRGSYEVGVVKRRDGRAGFQLLWDFYSGGYGLEAAVGKNGDLLKQGYQVNIAKKKSPPGYRLVQSRLPNGHVQLKYTKAS